MTATDLAVRDPQATAIPAKIQYARALAESGLLPASYRKQPANVLWAAEYGDMLGLSTMAAIVGVHVIDGKPGASAGLISALVRRAGHKLHVRGNGKSATCRITRYDDPKNPFEVTWTLRKNADDNPSAEEAKLLSKEVWQKYPASMLKARAITQCARDACEEALFGLRYTPEELGAEVDEDGDVVDEAGYDEQEHPVSRGRGTIFIDPDCLVENDVSRAAERGERIREDDPWYVRPAPQEDQPEPPAGDTRPWAEVALEQAKAGTFKSEAEALALWREAAVPGKCTPGQKDEIQNRAAAWIKAQRRKASDMALRQLPEAAADWKAAVEGLNGGDIDACREALEEVGRLKAAGTLDEVLAGRIGGAIIALCPKAAYAGDDSA